VHFQWNTSPNPAYHRTIATEVTHTLPAVTAPTDDPKPKALAGSGRLVRPGPQQADRRWLRLVAGRPVRAVTSAFWRGARPHSPLRAARVAVDLEHRPLAPQSGGAALEPPAPPAGQARRRRGGSRERPRAQQKPLVESPCAQRGAWQARRIGRGPAAAKDKAEIRELLSF
jgi:hypothetical protein